LRLNPIAHRSVREDLLPREVAATTKLGLGSPLASAEEKRAANQTAHTAPMRKKVGGKLAVRRLMAFLLTQTKARGQ
jgi:hypothetical protein